MLEEQFAQLQAT